MSPLEIILIILGIICIIVSFIFVSGEDAGKGVGSNTEISREQLEKMKTEIDGIIETELNSLEEKTEITVEKISNKKILEFTEYTDTVLAQINKNHQETMFLYDMLNEKAKAVKKTASQKTTAAQEAITAPLQSSEISEAPKPRKTRTRKATTEAVFDNTSTDIQPEKKPRRTRTTKQKSVVPQLSNNNERIISLHNEGNSNLEIAKKLGLGLGEVKLVVDLFTDGDI